VSFVIRAATAAEFDAIGRLTVEAYADAGQLTNANGYARTLADVAGRAADCEVLAAVDSDGTVLGAVAFVLPGSRYADLSRPGEAEFRMLAVAPDAQRRGVGKALVRACLARAAAAGASSVVISVPEIATRARRLYAGFGFQPEPERDWSPVPGVSLLALRLPVTPAGGGHSNGG
jgi:ribosomal protein S18 acetylase RimI-like enzyme